MRIGAAWIKADKNGNSFLSCNVNIPFLGKIYFNLFKNDKKENESAPDYIIDWNDAPQKKANNDDDIPL